MDSLKAALLKKKKEVQKLEEVTGGNKWISGLQARKAYDSTRTICALEEDRLTSLRDDQRINKLKEHLKYQHTNNAGNTENDSVTNAHTCDDDEPPPITRADAERRLRAYGEPITLFGESDTDRFSRLCNFEVDNTKDEMHGGQRNIFLELLENRGISTHNDDDDDTHTSPPPLKKLKPEGDTNTHTHTHTYTDKNGKHTHANSDQILTEDQRKADVIRCFIKHVLGLWEDILRNRSESEKASMEGRFTAAQHLQTRQNLRPLIKMLKQEFVERAVLDALYEMTTCCKDRDYVRAHHVYIDLAIGKAPWPMGVTMVGIHERAAQTKIMTAQIAHILNDETTRKYIHMYKRLMSLHQQLYPTTPSKTVNISVEESSIFPPNTVPVDTDTHTHTHTQISF
eukprot:GHVR01192858.1.p1 GENE.GHVR01192858.1~~GHVR01192858.1.p1  ORF type:complete len:398 (-),score=120.26 GHVR01192858.1:12-1205(-)